MDTDIRFYLIENLTEILSPMPGEPAQDLRSRMRLETLASNLLDELLLQVASENKEGLERMVQTILAVSPIEHYQRLRDQVPQVFHEERVKLGKMIREGFESHRSSAPWALFYLVLGFRQVVGLHVQRRISPPASLPPPSAFVYSMQ